jgi:hypothetical protein
MKGPRFLGPQAAQKPEDQYRKLFMDIRPRPSARIGAKGVTFALVGQNLCAARFAFGQKAEMRGALHDAILRPRHGLRQRAGMDRGGHKHLIPQIQDQHRQVDGDKAVFGQRLDDARINDDCKADAGVTQVLRCGRQVCGMQDGWPQVWAAGPVLVIWATLALLPDAADVLILLTYLGFGLSIIVPAMLNRDAPAVRALGDVRQTRRALDADQSDREPVVVPDQSDADRNALGREPPYTAARWPCPVRKAHAGVEVDPDCSGRTAFRGGNTQRHAGYLGCAERTAGRVRVKGPS